MNPSMNAENIIELLKKFALFNELDVDVLRIIASKITHETYPENTNIIQQEEIGEKIYFIVSGTAEAYTINKEGQPIILKKLSQGDYFGEIALLVGGYRTSNVRSTSECHLLSLSKFKFNDLLKTHPAISYALNHILSLRLVNEAHYFTDRKKNIVTLIYYSHERKEALQQFESYFQSITKKPIHILEYKGTVEEFIKINKTIVGGYIFVKTNDQFEDYILKHADHILNFIEEKPKQLTLLASDSAWQLEHIARVIAKKTIGIALCSGGLSALIHLMILKTLQNEKIPLDYIIGSGAGALAGGAYVFNTYQSILDAAKNQQPHAFFKLVKNIFCEHNKSLSESEVQVMLEELIGRKTMDAATIPFAATATDLHTGKLILLKKGEALNALNAAIVVPMIMPPVKKVMTKKGSKQELLLVDGVVTAPLPVQSLIDERVSLKIAVILPQFNPECAPPSESNHESIYLRSRSITTETLINIDAELADVIIRPDIRSVHDTEMLLAEGEAAAINAIKHIRSLFTI